MTMGKMDDPLNWEVAQLKSEIKTMTLILLLDTPKADLR